MRFLFGIQVLNTGLGLRLMAWGILGLDSRPRFESDGGFKFHT